MISTIEFRNFKALKNTTLSLGPFNLIVGPNGSGKSTVLQALRAIGRPGTVQYARIVSVDAEGLPAIAVQWEGSLKSVRTVFTWTPEGGNNQRYEGHEHLSNVQMKLLAEQPFGIRTYSFDGNQLALPVALQPDMELGPAGQNLAGVLDRLRDQAPERFEKLNRELSAWLPEFDRILFETPAPGQRELLLRLAKPQRAVRASELSHGSLFALVILTLAYDPNPPHIVGLEEPDRGIHPRLLRRIHDALYRLSHPEQSGESREPVKVVVTTHSPFLLDLYRDNPEEIVIAEKKNGAGSFTRLSEREDIQEILGDAPLGDLWYSGALGGVPQER
jgi:predicted ATPase